MSGSTFVEAFAGGGGAALALLVDGHVDRLILNDLDRAVYCFWRSVTRWSDEFIDRIQAAKLNMDEWHVQRAVYRHPGNAREVDLGFATFYLNRCNRSGIINNGGPIGGKEQKGTWRLDARFNKTELVRRVKRLADFGDRIEARRTDATELVASLGSELKGERLFVYADPPYWNKAEQLYLNHFASEDHLRFAECLSRVDDLKWAVTYDDVADLRTAYKAHQIVPFNLRYSAHIKSKSGGEVLIAPQGIQLTPDTLKMLKQLSGARSAL